MNHKLKRQIYVLNLSWVLNFKLKDQVEFKIPLILSKQTQPGDVKARFGSYLSHKDFVFY